MARQLPLSAFRESKGRMFKSIDFTFTYYQGCGATESEDPACPMCFTQFLPWGAISRIPRLLQTDPTRLIPESIRDVTIFLNSAHDTFAPIIPQEWVGSMLAWMAIQDPSITFYIQSKWIHLAKNFFQELTDVKDRIILGTTFMTTDPQLLKDYGFKIPPLATRRSGLLLMKSVGFRTRLSLEPLYRFNKYEMWKYIKEQQPELVEIGLDNYQKRHKLEIPLSPRNDYAWLIGRMEEEEITVKVKASLAKWIQEDSP